MATPDQEQVARIAAQQLGAEAPAPAEQAEAPTTPQEQAAETGSPTTEGDRVQQDPVVYKVKMGDEERALSPEQISSTFARYKDLNFRNAQMKPINQFAEQLMEKSGANPDQIAKLMQASVQAFTKNAQMGQNRPAQQGVAQPQQPAPTAQQPNIEEEFSKYEDENAISLPPGYREGMGRIERMEQQLSQGMNMLNQVLARSQQGAQQGMQAAQTAQVDRDTAIKQTISNNLDRAQQSAQLPDGDGNDFMRYAGERGYTIEDFADANLTMKVVNDYKNAKNTPEFARLQEMANRREAFLKSQSGGPASAPAQAQGDDTLMRLGATALAKNLGGVR
tara:strand:+ start:2214 stop:3218 length:1005 start_codon:yes stop_codon:yes gene_type:complete